MAFLGISLFCLENHDFFLEIRVNSGEHPVVNAKALKSQRITDGMDSQPYKRNGIYKK